MVTAFWRVISFIIAIGYFIAGAFTGVRNGDTITGYKNDVAKVAYENDYETAIPQTELYNIITSFFKGEDNGKEKKAIVIGYDGCRADNLKLMGETENSGIKTIVENGGHLKLSYCGGVNYPYINTQDTSTAPGWCSIVTGQWADVTGVTENDIVKSLEYPSLFTSLIDNNLADSTAFYVSWSGHFTDSDSTYFAEKKDAEDRKLDATFLKADDDIGTFNNVINDVKSDDCSDFIFSIFEYCDHFGHDTGFDPDNEDVAKAFTDNDKAAADIINAIKNRENYENEEWLIILTSDHGGVNSYHGGPTIQERYTFIAANIDF